MDCLDLLRELEAIADLPSGEPQPLPLAAPPRAENPDIAIVIPCFNHGEFLLDAIASGRPCRPSLYEGARVQAVMEAAAISAKEHRWVDVAK